jgi:hypothetical protein
LLNRDNENNACNPSRMNEVIDKLINLVAYCLLEGVEACTTATVQSVQP